ncbi:MAG: hypothetical protein JXL97_15740 [Bacteroidales bacterium]|nr:hypothetical protein [Bacteroidales bacterium]
MKLGKKTKALLNIIILMIFSYITMVFISHFSVYNKTEDYKISDSFKAMLFKTDVPSEFFIYFGILVVLTVIFAITINFLTQRNINSEKNNRLI